MRLVCGWIARGEAGNAGPGIHIARVASSERDDLSQTSSALASGGDARLPDLPRACRRTDRSSAGHRLGDIGTVLLDRPVVDSERLLACQYGSPLSVGAHADSAVVARTEKRPAGHSEGWPVQVSPQSRRSQGSPLRVN